MNLNTDNLLTAFPQMPKSFENKIDYSLSNLNRNRNINIKRKFVVVFASMVLIIFSIIGVSEGLKLGLLDFLFNKNEAPENVVELLQSDLAYAKINDVELTASECLYDGATIKFVININTKINEMLTDVDVNDYDSSFNKELRDNNIILQGGLDWFSINDTDYSMTNLSTQEIIADNNKNGSAIAYFEIYTNDTNINIPEDSFSLGIPVAQKGKTDTMKMILPIKVINNSQIKELKADDVYLEYGKISNVYARLSPLKTYLGIKMEFYSCAENEDCQDTINAWSEFALVDKEGKILGGKGDVVSSGDNVDDKGTRRIMLEYQYEPLETYPDELYIAPVEYNGIELESNMDREIKLIGG